MFINTSLIRPIMTIGLRRCIRIPVVAHKIETQAKIVIILYGVSGNNFLHERE